MVTDLGSQGPRDTDAINLSTVGDGVVYLLILIVDESCRFDIREYVLRLRAGVDEISMNK